MQTYFKGNFYPDGTGDYWDFETSTIAEGSALTIEIRQIEDEEKFRLAQKSKSVIRERGRERNRFALNTKGFARNQYFNKAIR